MACGAIIVFSSWKFYIIIKKKDMKSVQVHPDLRSLPFVLPSDKEC